MCFPSIKNILAFLGLIFTIGLVVIALGPDAVSIPVEKISSYLPKPHISVTLSSQRGSERIPDFSPAYRDAGFHVEKGNLVPMKNCSSCFGSPQDTPQYLAVAFDDGDLIEPCGNYENKSTCFRMRKNDAIVIIAELPPRDLFLECSWGVYLYDSYDEGQRYIIQAGVGDPLRLRESQTMAIIISMMPEMTDVLVESINLPNMRPHDIHVLAIPDELVYSEGPQYDRISIIFKGLPENPQTSESLYGYISKATSVMKLSIQDEVSAAKVREGASYSPNSIVSFSRSDPPVESTFYSAYISGIVTQIQQSYNVIETQTMADFREALSVNTLGKCIEEKQNCLGEDWDVAFSVSGPLVFPDPPNYRIMVLGMEHDGYRTTLGLFDSSTNSEVANLAIQSDSTGVYSLFIARNCTETAENCFEVTSEMAPNATALFLRERVYGSRSYSGLVKPTVLKMQ